VAKIWRWAEERKPKNGYVLIQAFSTVYDDTDPRRRNAEFIGQQMQKQVPKAKYISLPFRYRPTKGGKKGGGARHRRADELAIRVVKELKAHRLVP
jgi:hypothetical protein